MSTQTEPRMALAYREGWEFGMPNGPGTESGEGGRPARGPAARAMVPVSVVWLALAALIGLIAAVLGARRTQPAPAQPAPAQPASAQPASAQPAPDRDREPGRDEGPARPARYAGAALLIAVLFAGLLIFGYNQLNTWYRPVTLTAKTTSLGSASLGSAGLGSASLGSASVSSADSAVQWSMTGFVGRLTVAGPDTGSAEIMLPVPVSSCPAVTAKLGVPCGTGGITLPSPAIFSWSPAQELSVSGQTTAGLQIEPSTGAHGAPSVTVSAMSGHPVLCLSPLGPAKLTIAVGGHRYTQPFPGFAACDGVTATIGSPGTLPPSFELDAIDGLTLTAAASTATLQGFTGQIMLKPGGTSVQGSPTVVSLRSAGAGRLTATLSAMTGSQALTVTSPAAASVMTGDGELVPSEWARETAVFGPLLAGLVTALVVAPLGVALGVLTDTLKRWPGPRRRGRKEAGHEA